MGRVLKANFYYGAILTTILQKNPDAIPTLILADGESKQIYKMITNSSKHEYILFFKYASIRFGRIPKSFMECKMVYRMILQYFTKIRDYPHANCPNQNFSFVQITQNSRICLPKK